MARYDKDIANGLVHGTTLLSSLGGGDSLTSTGAININSDIGDINFQDGDVNQLALNLDGSAGEIIVKLMVDGDDLVFLQFDGTEVFRLKHEGGVGIGGDPSTTLHVQATDPRIRVDATAGNHPGFELSEAGTRKWLMYNNPANDNLIFKSTVDRLEITQAGNILLDGYATHLKRIVDVDAALDLSSVATALPYSGAIFSVEMDGSSAYAITLPTATSTAEATSIIGWYASVIITNPAAANVTVVRGDPGNDGIGGIVVAGDAASSGITIGSNVITFVGDTAVFGDRVDITCVAASPSNTFYVCQAMCSV